MMEQSRGFSEAEVGDQDHLDLLSPSLLPCTPGLRSPVISIDPPSSTVQQGQDTSFKCLIHEGAAPINIEWKARNQELEGEPCQLGDMKDK